MTRSTKYQGIYGYFCDNVVYPDFFNIVVPSGGLVFLLILVIILMIYVIHNAPEPRLLLALHSILNVKTWSAFAR